MDTRKIAKEREARKSMDTIMSQDRATARCGKEPE
jgi:hypothetical protein